MIAAWFPGTSRNPDIGSAFFLAFYANGKTFHIKNTLADAVLSRTVSSTWETHDRPSKSTSTEAARIPYYPAMLEFLCLLVIQPLALRPKNNSVATTITTVRAPVIGAHCLTDPKLVCLLTKSLVCCTECQCTQHFPKSIARGHIGAFPTSQVYTRNDDTALTSPWQLGKVVVDDLTVV